MKKARITTEEIKSYAEANNCTLLQARDRLRLLRSNTPRACWVRTYCAMYGKSLAAGAYAYQKIFVEKSEFDPLKFVEPRNTVRLADVKDFEVIPNELSEYGVDVFYKNKLVKAHRINRWFYIYNRNTKRQIAVATLVWVLHYKKPIEGGYVVDHVNNVAEDNRIENLQLVSWGDNVRKNAVGHNQWTNKKGE